MLCRRTSWGWRVGVQVGAPFLLLHHHPHPTQSQKKKKKKRERKISFVWPTRFRFRHRSCFSTETTETWAGSWALWSMILISPYLLFAFSGRLLQSPRSVPWLAVSDLFHVPLIICIFILWGEKKTQHFFTLSFLGVCTKPAAPVSTSEA